MLFVFGIFLLGFVSADPISDTCSRLEYDTVSCFQYFGYQDVDLSLSPLSLTKNYASLCSTSEQFVSCINDLKAACPTYRNVNPMYMDELSFRVIIFGTCKYYNDFKRGELCIGKDFKDLGDYINLEIYNSAVFAYSVTAFETGEWEDFCYLFQARTEDVMKLIEPYNCGEAFYEYIRNSVNTLAPVECDEYITENVWRNDYLLHLNSSLATSFVPDLSLGVACIAIPFLLT